MAKESLKEMLLNVKPGDFDKIMRHQITQEDIKDFYDLYCEFASLETDYQQMILGRKDAAKDLTKRLELLKQMSELISRGMKIQNTHYEYASRDLKNSNIDEKQYNKVFEVLRQLASNESVQYEIKTITYPAYDSNDRHGYRTTDEYTGEITILAEKEALSKFESDKKIPYLNQEMLEEIYKHGFSMVLFGNEEHKTERLNLPNKQILGYYHPIVFYLQDDNLAIAIRSFISFIQENGADLNQIETCDLVETIKSKYQKKNSQKELTPIKKLAINQKC